MSEKTFLITWVCLTLLCYAAIALLDTYRWTQVNLPRIFHKERCKDTGFKPSIKQKWNVILQMWPYFIRSLNDYKLSVASWHHYSTIMMPYESLTFTTFTYWCPMNRKSRHQVFYQRTMRGKVDFLTGARYQTELIKWCIKHKLDVLHHQTDVMNKVLHLDNDMISVHYYWPTVKELINTWPQRYRIVLYQWAKKHKVSLDTKMLSHTFFNILPKRYRDYKIHSNFNTPSP